MAKLIIKATKKDESVTSTPVELEEYNFWTLVDLEDRIEQLERQHLPLWKKIKNRFIKESE